MSLIILEGRNENVELFNKKRSNKASVPLADAYGAVELSEEQLDAVSGGDRPGHHEPPRTISPYMGAKDSVFQKP